MAKIPFTFRELKSANQWTYNGWSVVNKTNAHRLLLFYSVECGLKAVYLKRNRLDLFDSSTVPEKMFNHDLNHMLEELRVGKEFFLKSQVELSPIVIKKDNRAEARKYTSSNLNQVWRYGGKLTNPENDEKFEHQLCKISEWIKGEL